jgi:hypothetical protein
MAGASAQAATENSSIYVPTAAGRGILKSLSADSGDMWIVMLQPVKTWIGLAESSDVLAPAYQRLPTAEE